MTREEAINVINHLQYSSPHEAAEQVAAKKYYSELLRAYIKNTKPVKHGMWETVHDNNGVHQVCPYCGEWRYHSKQLYCGNCGARMDAQIGEDKSHPFAESVMMGTDGGKDD